MTTKEKPVELTPPDEFYKIVNDFVSDILITFPEYSGLISKWWNRPTNNVEESRQKETLFVFRHCVKVFPERFFDILYKRDEIFHLDSDVRTDFLPGIVFTQLWNLDISDKTKETMWKYLQLILFSVIGCVHSSSDLGDAAKLFEAIDEEELKSKLEETLEGMRNIFDNNPGEEGTENNGETSSNYIPNAEQLQSHIHSMMDGKLGKLAMELAEETAKDLNLDPTNTGDAKDVFNKLFKNPGKMMNMVKNISGKIDEKLKSGELKESEIMEEGMELLEKMKNMPGMGDMQKIFSQMGIPGLGKGAKINIGAMEAQLNRNMKNAKLKERLRAKADANARAKEQASTAFCNMSDSNSVKVFSTGETVDKTPRNAKPSELTKQNESNKSKNGKKKGKK